jgi:hypothetical protein
MVISQSTIGYINNWIIAIIAYILGHPPVN